ncbi:hypothetical protein [Cupriavidus sp. UME77]|uniref:hypothetical protein n=1 Tax=Cupriavidus sp. UME77 TaxID=1862321 RepID=UPI001602DCE3|nr:hypothetical protein [Cupriavidus sp. UME77]
MEKSKLDVLLNVYTLKTLTFVLRKHLKLTDEELIADLRDALAGMTLGVERDNEAHGLSIPTLEPWMALMIARMFHIPQEKAAQAFGTAPLPGDQPE